ncbi:uncharacterized protein BDW70DRAFT_165226 [Aspergillus foveolatus]|uniref:uncharacterized protein n=1 Tax=Aspergillus foveolatus TaxID=210207 RepID=UPI003CCDBEE0
MPTLAKRKREGPGSTADFRQSLLPSSLGRWTGGGAGDGQREVLSYMGKTKSLTRSEHLPG